MKISVIIPGYNEEKTIGSCLASIFKTKCKDFEVILVDDCSTDNTINLAKKYPCRIIRLKKNSGASIARNTGAKNAKGELLYFTDADIIQKTDNLVLISKILKKNPNIKIINAIHHWKSPINGFGPEFIGVKYYYDYDLLLRKNIHKIKSTWFQALGGFIPKKIFLESGGFNEKIHLGGEEFELGYRLKSLGYEIYTLLDLEVYHYWWGLKKRINLNYKRSQDWLPILLKRRNFEAAGGVATKKNAINCLLLALTILSFGAAIFIDCIYVPLSLLVIYLIYNLDFYRYVYRTKRKIGFTFLSIFADMSLYISTGIGISIGIIKQLFNKRPY